MHEMFKVCDVTHSESRTYKDARWDLNDGEELVSISTPDGDVANIAHLYTRGQGEYDSFSVKAAAKWKCSRAIEFGEKIIINDVKKALLPLRKPPEICRALYVETCWQLVYKIRSLQTQLSI